MQVSRSFTIAVMSTPKQFLETDLSAYIHMEPISHQQKKQLLFQASKQ